MRTGGNLRIQTRQINRKQDEPQSNHGGGGAKRGTIAVVGIGPGTDKLMTAEAQETIRSAGLVIGYRTYLKQIESLLAGKKVLAYGMTEEVLRARAAVEAARSGIKVVVVSGGDPGVYGMAGLILEVGIPEETEIRIIPGVTAATAAAAYLGAPLMHDFAVISLSDRLTPWQIIRNRVEAAASADFVIALYNPASQGRINQIKEVQAILLKSRIPKTPVGVVKGAYRPEEQTYISDLEHFLELDIDMNTTVIIGNSQTRVIGGKMITPRGYVL